MLKRRLIPVLYIMNGLIVRSEKYTTHQMLGNVISETSRYDSWNVDELIYIDISRDKHYDLRRDDLKVQSLNSIEDIIDAISNVCFMPLTFGGGIRTLEHIDHLIANGVEKVTLNTGAFENPNLINEASKKYGAQCVVASIDYKIVNERPIVFTNLGRHNTEISVYDWAKECEERGCGELFLNSIDRDGTGSGYDIDTIDNLVAKSKRPVIACGGAGDIDDFVELAEETAVSAIAAGNIFHFTELAYPRAKQFLKKRGIDVR